MNTANHIKSALQQVANPDKAAFYPKFFKTGPGEYAEGDKFLGITVPHQRAIAKRSLDTPQSELQILLGSPIHEHRLTALIILTYQFPKTNTSNQKSIYHFYLSNTHNINNWDLVDVSCHKIVGSYALEHPAAIETIRRLSHSSDLWERRISMVSTAAFIADNQLDLPIEIAHTLVDDSHHLIHKAVGWMLRELGKKDNHTLFTFLDQHAATMPRTALRYALEKQDQPTKIHYMQLKDNPTKQN